MLSVINSFAADCQEPPPVSIRRTSPLSPNSTDGYGNLPAVPVPESRARYQPVNVPHVRPPHHRPLLKKIGRLRYLHLSDEARTGPVYRPAPREAPGQAGRWPGEAPYW